MYCTLHQNQVPTCSAWLGLTQGAFTCGMACQVMLFDPIWQVMLCSIEIGSCEELYAPLMISMVIC